MGDKNIRVSTQLEHSITNLLDYAPTTEPGIALRQWVNYQGIDNHVDLLSWEEDEVKANPTQQIFCLDDKGQGSYLRTNQVKQICGLITYMKHVFKEYMSEEVRPAPFHIFSPEEWSQHTSTMMRTFLVQNLLNPIRPEPVTSGPISSSKPTTYSPAALELMSFKKGIKREITAYPSLKDERYFDGFKRSLFIVAKTHECSDVLDPNYTPGSDDTIPTRNGRELGERWVSKVGTNFRITKLAENCCLVRTQYNFCTQQLRCVGIIMIVILFGLNLCAETLDR